ncbi:hypothetical protein BH09DEP1_BH09DEP1_0770 [soil metagenome]
MKKIILFIFILGVQQAQARWPFDLFEHKKPFTLILEASGDALHAGRTIGNHFENSISFTICHQIKEIIDAQHLRMRLFINRTPTEVIMPLQNAQFSNKLNTDLYLSINCYQHTQSKPRITLYHYSYNDSFVLKKGCLGFYTADQVYLLNEPQTNSWASELKKILYEQDQIEIQGTYKLPFKPLAGIEASAIGIEIGISSDHELPLIITSVSQALELFLRRHAS